MKPDDIDWSILRGSLIILCCALLVSGGMLGGSFYFQDEMTRDFKRHNAEFKSISQRYLAIDEEEKLIKKYFPLFVNLYNDGVIGREQRLNWIEVLRNAGEEIKIPSLNYQIKSQKDYKPGFTVTMGRYKLYSSTMMLSMQLLHEGDLFRLFEELDKHANGSYSITGCRLHRSAFIVLDSPQAANVIAECDLQWFTIKLADGTDLKV